MATPIPTLARLPTLSSSCARAATAAEARFRIDYPDLSRRDSRVIALDEGTAGLARDLAAATGRWRGGHFLVFDRDVVLAGDDTRLRTAAGEPVRLSSELASADVVVMLAAPAGDPGPSADAAAVIGDACAARSIMSAGLVVPGDGPADAVVSALRPNAMVLVVLQDRDDVAEVLSALRV
jgi:hypothetical protein